MYKPSSHPTSKPYCNFKPPFLSSSTTLHVRHNNSNSLNIIHSFFPRVINCNSSVSQIRSFSKTKLQCDYNQHGGEKTATDDNKAELYLDAGACIIPHPDKQHRGGEDAYFIARGQAIDAMGVADGVGGWQRQGIDPGPFSRHLMQAAAKAVVDDNVQDPFTIISKAFYKGVFNKYIGSSTCCLALLHHKQNTLETVNIGDSATVVIRKEKNSKNPKVVGESTALVAGFNAPFQLTNLVSKSEQKDLSKSHQSNLAVNPEDGTPSDIKVKHGDIVVMASDGFFDNVHENEMIQQVSSCISDPLTPKDCAQQLAKLAFRFSNDRKRLSPFAEEALRHRMRYIGGKPDDITVLVARVLDANEAQSSQTLRPRGTYEFEPKLGVEIDN